MAAVEKTIAQTPGVELAAASSPGRAPPKANVILLPVWGDEFIDQFLERSLPTLLAPGNIPTLAKRLPTRFVFLSRVLDEAIFRGHPAFRGLERHVDVEFLPIDDLITSGNHSTTITLAYARAVRAAGDAMLDTCFFFLVSDYIMADGSLSAVLARMLAGASGVQVGNFQLDERQADPWLIKRLAAGGEMLALSPREIMRWSLGCLHAITAANIINIPVSHNVEANRLLWRVDGDTLIGRFFLLHMICIRPETTDFTIGASCDYSFVPEMCPSGNVVTITDSDDYLVVEVQPGGHERQFLRLGPPRPEMLAKSLSRWTTAGHRSNARDTIVFHAGELPPQLAAVRAEAEAFVRDLTPRLAPRPQPHRDHPYWRGAIAAFNAAVTQRQAVIDGTSRLGPLGLMRNIAVKVFGRPPEVARVHPRWKDFTAPLAACGALAADERGRVLLVSSRSTPSIEWLRRRACSGVFTSLRRVQQRRLRGIAPASLDTVFFDLVDGEIADVGETLQHLSPLLRPGAEIIVSAINANWFDDPENFARAVAAGSGSLVRPELILEEFRTVTATRLRWRLNARTVAVARAVIERPSLSLPLSLIKVASLLPLAMAANLLDSYRPERPPHGRFATSVFLRLRANPARDAN